MTEQAPEQPQTEPEPVEGSDAPWGDNFDAEKAWKRITKQSRDIDTLRQQLKDAAPKLAEYEKLADAQKTEAQRAQEELGRWQADAEKWRATAVASTVRAHAAAEFADPDDAVRNVDPAKYLDASGVIDEKAIEADLAKLLEKKPHYRRQTEAQGPRLPKPNPHQGSGQGGRPAGDPAQEFASILQNSLAR